MGNAPVTGEHSKSRLRTKIFAGALASTLLMGGAAHAENYKFGETDVSLDTPLSAGVSMRTSARDCEKITRSMAVAHAQTDVQQASTATMAI